MADRPRPRLAALLGLCALAAAPVAAHQLKVFAAAEGAHIQGRVQYAGGWPAEGAVVTVRAPDGRVLESLTADRMGRFAFEATERVDHGFSAGTGDGHGAAWTVSAAELPAALPAPGVEAGASSGGGLAVASAAPVQPAAADLEAMIERAVARQVRPLREELQSAQERARIADVLGGIGYIFGVAGITLWWRARRRGPGG